MQYCVPLSTVIPHSSHDQPNTLTFQSKELLSGNQHLTTLVHCWQQC